MVPDDSSNLPDPADDDHGQWARLCDDFVNLEGQCALLCELLTSLSRRDLPLDPAGRHGIDMFGTQLKKRLAAFKQQLYKVRPEPD